jgi:hypothetical protein
VSRLREGRRWIAFALALPVCALAVAFWSQGTIDPLIAPALLLDRSLQVLTLGLIPAVVLVIVAPVRPAIYAVTLIGTVGVMLGSAVTFSGVIRPPRDWNAIALAVVVLACGCTLLLRHSRELPGLRSVPGKVVAFALAAAIPLLQLTGNAAFLPSRTEATLNQKVSLKVADRTGEALRTEVAYEVKNPTDVRMIVLASRLTVCWWTDEQQPDFDQDHLVDQTNCSASRPITAGSWVSPDSGLENARALMIPLDHPRVTVISRIAFARGDRLRAGEVVEQAAIGRCHNVRTIRLEDGSRVQSLADSPKHLVYWDPTGRGALRFKFDSGSRINCPPRDPAHLGKYYGFTENNQVREVWLTAPGGAKDASNRRTRGL